MTRTYKFSNKDFNKNRLASTNIKIVLAILALIIISATLDLSVLQVVSESATFM